MFFLAFCDYWRFGTGGHQENVNAICILALNIINDKVGWSWVDHESWFVFKYYSFIIALNIINTMSTMNHGSCLEYYCFTMVLLILVIFLSIFIIMVKIIMIVIIIRFSWSCGGGWECCSSWLPSDSSIVQSSASTIRTSVEKGWFAFYLPLLECKPNISTPIYEHQTCCRKVLTPNWPNDILSFIEHVLVVDIPKFTNRNSDILRSHSTNCHIQVLLDSLWVAQHENEPVNIFNPSQRADFQMFWMHISIMKCWIFQILTT